MSWLFTFICATVYGCKRFLQFLGLKSRIVRGTIITDLGLVAMKARIFSLLVVSLLLEADRVSDNLALECYC